MALSSKIIAKVTSKSVETSLIRNNDFSRLFQEFNNKTEYMTHDNGVALECEADGGEAETGRVSNVHRRCARERREVHRQRNARSRILE